MIDYHAGKLQTKGVVGQKSMRTEKKWGEGTWLDMGEPVAKGFCWQETNTNEE